MIAKQYSSIRWAAALLQFALKLGAKDESRTSPRGYGQPDNPDDLRQLRRLDPEAITRVHRQYFEKVFRYARFRLDDEKLAEDAAAEAFIRLLESLHAGKGPRTSVGGWLMRTVSNLVNDYYRLHYARPTEELSDQTPTGNPGPAALAETSEEHHYLNKALKELTHEQQQVLALRFGSGYSLAETADLMKKKPNAIKALQFRAIGALRRAMEVTNE